MRGVSQRYGATVALDGASFAVRPGEVSQDAFVFRGLIPRVHTFKKDLAAAEIPFHDARGRRVDIHALRKTFGTLLASGGVAPRVAMELMRHSDLKLTTNLYTDSSQLPLAAGVARDMRARAPGSRGLRSDGINGPLDRRRARLLRVAWPELGARRLHQGQAH